MASLLSIAVCRSHLHPLYVSHIAIQIWTKLPSSFHWPYFYVFLCCLLRWRHLMHYLIYYFHSKQFIKQLYIPLPILHQVFDFLMSNIPVSAVFHHRVEIPYSIPIIIPTMSISSPYSPSYKMICEVPNLQYLLSYLGPSSYFPYHLFRMELSAVFIQYKLTLNWVFGSEFPP